MSRLLVVITMLALLVCVVPADACPQPVGFVGQAYSTCTPSVDPAPVQLQAPVQVPVQVTAPMTYGSCGVSVGATYAAPVAVAAPYVGAFRTFNYGYHAGVVHVGHVGVPRVVVGVPRAAVVTPNVTVIRNGLFRRNTVIVR